MIPKGYRKLKVGERLREGDLFQWLDGKWIETLSPGQKTKTATAYIRKRKGRR